MESVIVPKQNKTNAGYGKLEIKFGIVGIPAKLVNVPPISKHILPKNIPIAVPKIPTITPMIVVKIGVNIIMDKIKIHIFNIELILIFFFVLSFL